MSQATATRATTDDLYREEGKAELIGGRIVRFMPSGHLPIRVAANIYVELRLYERTTQKGFAYTDGIGYSVPELPSGRESFSPDVSYYTGNVPANLMRFIEGAPTLAVEVRSENDYGPAAEMEMAAKREDYFQAGTLTVWDVDPQAETVALYRAGDQATLAVFRRGDWAHAEPALSGWRMAVDDVFAP
jgi:Uma2 family endonuclease